LAELDTAFHETLSALIGNETLLQNLRSINERLLVFRMIDFDKANRVQSTCEQHLAILSRISDRDGPGARAALRKNIEEGRSIVRNTMKEALAARIRCTEAPSVRLAATRIGAGVATGDFSGAVRETFRNACILAVDGTLIALVPQAAGSLPAAITLALESGFAFDKEIAVGSEVAARGGVLRIKGARCAIDLRSATRWRSNLAALDLDLWSAPMSAAWEVANDALETDGRHRALLGIASEHIDVLVVALRRSRRLDASAAAMRLIGLGAGGTPAGDDFLVGCLAALWSSRRTRDSGLAARLGVAIANESRRTNVVSRVYLEAAAIGEVSERLTDLIRAIAEGSAKDSARAAVAAIAVGHTSGADGVFGLLLAAKAIGRRQAKPTGSVQTTMTEANRPA